MDSLIRSLNLRFDAVLESADGPRFYQNLHHYFDLVIKNPILQKLYQDSEKELRDKHIEIWAHQGKLTDEEADDRSERTTRSERFNLYAAGCFLEAWVYTPLEDYKNSLHESEFDQFPSAVLMMKGIENINPEYAKKNPFKWGKEKMKSLSRRYTGKRAEYESRLRHFHLLLIAAVENAQSVPITTPAEPTQDIPLKFNARTGDFSIYEIEGSLTPKSQEYNILTTLLNSEEYFASYDALIKAMRPHAQDSKVQRVDLTKAILRLKEKMHMINEHTNIFQNVRGTGYRLVFPISIPKE